MAIFSIRGEIRVFSRRNFVISARIFIFAQSYFSLLIFLTMPRTYDRLIRFYDSWFGDLLDPDKGFTPEECWNVILAVRECQREITLEPLKKLPLNIRRGLQMRTLETQIVKILEHTGRMATRGAAGGNAAQKAAQERAKIASEQREKEREEFNRQCEEREKKSISLAQYKIWREKNVLNEQGLPGPNWEERVKYALPETIEKWKKYNIKP